LKIYNTILTNAQFTTISQFTTADEYAVRMPSFKLNTNTSGNVTGVAINTGNVINPIKVPNPTTNLTVGSNNDYILCMDASGVLKRTNITYAQLKTACGISTSTP
jgi:hypothetical protein